MLNFQARDKGFPPLISHLPPRRRGNPESSVSRVPPPSLNPEGVWKVSIPSPKKDLGGR